MGWQKLAEKFETNSEEVRKRWRRVVYQSIKR
jgi:hypothetical protein